MNDLVLTPGPWGWRQPAGSRQINLCTVGRGMLFVLSPARAGMNGATILFGHRTAEDRGGLLREVPVREHRSPDYLRDDELTPDARLIQAAPELLALVRRIFNAPGSEKLPREIRDEIFAVLDRVIPPTGIPDGEGLTVDDAVAKHAREHEKLESLGLAPPTGGGAS